jgi:hypothetical protein
LIKREENFPHIKENSEWIECTAQHSQILYDEGLPNIGGNAQIFSHIGEGR